MNNETKLYRFIEGRIEEASKVEAGYQYFTATIVGGMVKSMELHDRTTATDTVYLNGREVDVVWEKTKQDACTLPMKVTKDRE